MLDAAVRAFARGGYAGTSTDAVAKEAAVSQPYVVRIFGTKLDLFLEVFHRVMERIGTAFADELASGPFDPDNEEDWTRLGATYTELLVDRDLLMVMMHGMIASGEPRIGAASRHCMAQGLHDPQLHRLHRRPGPRLHRAGDAAQRDARDGGARPPR